jgi:hypothetical protein
VVSDCLGDLRPWFWGYPGFSNMINGFWEVDLEMIFNVHLLVVIIYENVVWINS